MYDAHSTDASTAALPTYSGQKNSMNLYLSHWGTPHSMAPKIHAHEYTVGVDEFLTAKAPGSGTPRVALSKRVQSTNQTNLSGSR